MSLGSQERFPLQHRSEGKCCRLVILVTETALTGSISKPFYPGLPILVRQSSGRTPTEHGMSSGKRMIPDVMVLKEMPLAIILKGPIMTGYQLQNYIQPGASD